MKSVLPDVARYHGVAVKAVEADRSGRPSA